MAKVNKKKKPVILVKPPLRTPSDFKVLIVSDKWKGSFTTDQIGTLISQNLAPFPAIWLPIADGGEGSLHVIETIFNGIERRTFEVTGPRLTQKVQADYLWDPKTYTAYLELAQTSGLAYLAQNERNPEETTTLGMGELILEVLKLNPEKIYVTVGGSATNDGGIGCLTALGWKFLDVLGNPLPPIGGSLLQIERILRPILKLPEIFVLHDVRSPLSGPNGAAHTFARQKGANSAMVERLDRGLYNLRAVCKRDLDLRICVPGAGAGGGFAGGLRFGLEANLLPGFATLAKWSGLRQAISKVDVVITGEGKFDEQSETGKVVFGVLELAKEYKKFAVIVTGQSHLPKLPGKIPIFSLVGPERTLATAMKEPIQAVVQICPLIISHLEALVERVNNPPLKKK